MSPKKLTVMIDRSTNRYRSISVPDHYAVDGRRLLYCKQYFQWLDLVRTVFLPIDFLHSTTIVDVLELRIGNIFLFFVRFSVSVSQIQDLLGLQVSDEIGILNHLHPLFQRIKTHHIEVTILII